MNKKIFLSIVFAHISLIISAQTIIKPSIKSRTSFAIIIDSLSYEKTKEALSAYRNVIENDGLGTYIISNNWNSPDQIRDLLIKLHSDKKSPLEGIVLVGDIPIAMIRDAQHLTSAFKMNQKRNWQQSSVASDRFYDDFDLKFNFLKQDSIKPSYFYYSLRADSKHRIFSDIYSARIKPLENIATDKYIQLEKYLHKIVEERRTNVNNVIDNLTMARGHGYNSESMTAWAGEQSALKEQFPELFKANNHVRVMDFETSWPMKPVWLNEIQRPELDIMLFHHHGSNDYQYINGYKNGSDVNTSIDNIKLYLRSKIKPAVDEGKDKEETIKHYMDYLDVPRSWCEESFNPKLIEEDSIYNLNLDITLSDIYKIAPNARFVMFDACYNGSFYEDEYIAGAYIFNDGKTIVTQGNTVNAIQDKWPDEFIGLLNAGARVGQWGKQVHYLETHIIGDPTFRFANRSEVKFDINEALSIFGSNVNYWKKLIKHSNVDIQCVALRILTYFNYTGISEILKETYFNSNSSLVRLEALKQLSYINDHNFVEVLKSSLFDNYELTRRFSMDYIAKNGSDLLIPSFVKAYVIDNEFERVRFKAEDAIKALDYNNTVEEINKQVANKPLYDRSLIDKIVNNVDSIKESDMKDLSLISDTTTLAKYKRQEINIFRNKPVVRAIETLLSFASDSSRDRELRIQAIETLGWYNYSCRRTYIINGLKKIADSERNENIINEAHKSINRLSEFSYQ